MASKSSILPRFGFGRDNGQGLPFHNQTTPPIRKKQSEYSLADLSPRPDDTSRSPTAERSLQPTRYSDEISQSGSDSKAKPKRHGKTYDGLPPPIFRSTLLYSDEEHGGGAPAQSRHLERASSSFQTALTSVSSVLFDRPARSSSHATNGRQTFEPDTIWRNLQRRERGLEKELQELLNAQSEGLAAHLDPGAAAPSSAVSEYSDAGSHTPTGAGVSQYFADRRGRRHVGLGDEHPEAEAVVPVRQPRRKRMGLSASRVAIARNMALLGDLKAEEDAVLTAALGTRKKALAQLRRLAGRREGLVEELAVLEGDDGEPLGQELRELGDERKAVSSEIAELEERLVGLRNRKRWLDGRIEDVKNRKEAGLSGYRNALREVDGGLDNLLRRPPVKPLDLEALRGDVGRHESDQSPGGLEFVRLRPERRTTEMARDWWESEARILEDRRVEVDKERNALEEGVQMWRDVVQLISDFETGLKHELMGGPLNDPKGKGKPLSPQEAVHAQLDKMGEVMASLEKRLQTAEERGWNLLIVAIGAELQAFREATQMLQEALRTVAFVGQEDDVGADADDDDDEATPQLGRSASGKLSPRKQDQSPTKEKLVDLNDDTHTTATESDNEVPQGLLIAPKDESDEDEPREQNDHGPTLTSRHSIDRPESQSSQSGNEVPPEFLAEHSKDE